MFDHTLLAENIKKHRLANRLTQTQLAEMTNVSCQAISKWERGIAIPELDKLCLLADAFHCTVDRLIGNVQTGQKMLMGVDGGGSKTEFVLFDEEGTIHETLILSACNPNAIGLEGSVEILVQGIEHMKAICPNLQGVFIGSAGFKSGGKPAFGRQRCTHIQRSPAPEAQPPGNAGRHGPHRGNQSLR